MDSSNGEDSKNKQYNITLLLSNNQTNVFSKDFNDALLQFVTSASLIQNESLSNWQLDLINSPVRDYYYVENNGLKMLRSASQEIVTRFFTYYQGKDDTFKVWLYVQLGLIIFMLLLTINTSIWSHVRLLSIYKQVTIFLGHMTAADIRVMRVAVDEFEGNELANIEDADSEDQENLANANAANMDVFDEEEGRARENARENKLRYGNPNLHLQEIDNDNENERLLLKQEENVEKKMPIYDEPNEGIIMDEIEEAVEEKDKQDKIESRLREELETNFKLANAKKIDPNTKREDALRAYLQQEKIEFLSNKRTIYLKIPYFTIILNGILLVSLFTVTLWQSFDYLYTLESIFNFHKDIGERIPNLQYLVDLTRDTIINDRYKEYAGVQLLSKYMDDIEELDDRLNKYNTSVWGSHFNPFNSIFSTFSLSNLCDAYQNFTGTSLTSSSSLSITLDSCMILENPILTKGESISVISTVNYAREIVHSYLRQKAVAADNAAVKAAKIASMTTNNLLILVDINDALNKSINYEITTFKQNWQSLNSTYLTISVPLFAGLIVYLLLTLVYYLLRSIAKLRQRVSYNKGLLCLVRREIIMNNKSLQAMILEGDISEMLE